MHRKLLRLAARVPAFLAAVVCGAFLIRMIVVAGLISQVATHSLNYNDFGWESWEMGWVARSIVLGHGFASPFLPLTGPTALVPPLYPYLIAGIFKLFGLNTVKVAFALLGFNSLCSALTCVPLYFLVLDSLNRRAARIAALGWALYPFAIYFAADRVWDYALTGLLFSCCLLLAQRLHQRGPLAWLGFGLLFGVTILSNPSVVTVLPVLLLIALYKSHRARATSFARLLGKALLAAVAFVLVCTPWTLRNQRVMHASFFMRDGFWLEFYAGNNGDTSASNSAWVHPASNPVEMTKYQQLGEIAYMAQKRSLSLDFVHHHPGFFAIASLRRVVRFWTGFWSFSPAYLRFEPMDLPNVPFCIFLLFFMVRGLHRWWLQDKPAVLPYLVALLIFPIPYYLTHASMDYRMPIEPIIIVLVTIGLFGTGAKRLSRKNTAQALAQREANAVLV